MKKTLKNNKGFTLIELVIVIAILGVLAAIAISMFPRLTGTSRERADQVRATQIKQAISTFIAESGDTTASLLTEQAAGALGQVDTDIVLKNIQLQVVDGADATKKYGPYVEDVNGAHLPKSYYPQSNGTYGWAITITKDTGNVTVATATSVALNKCTVN